MADSRHQYVHIHANAYAGSQPRDVYIETINDVPTRLLTVAGDTMMAASHSDGGDFDDALTWYRDSSVVSGVVDFPDVSARQFEHMWTAAMAGSEIDRFISFDHGDATNPSTSSTLIVHVVNNLGKWGKGFVVPLAKRYPKAKQAYLDWQHRHENFSLGEVQFVITDEKNMIVVGNMLAQDGIRAHAHDRKTYIDYHALERCLTAVADYALSHRLRVQAPKIGAGLGGGDWDRILGLIKHTLCYKRVSCRILELPKPLPVR